MFIQTNDVAVLGDIDKQLFGLTDQHIHYLSHPSLTNKSLTHNGASTNAASKSAKAPSKSNIGINLQMRTAFDALKKSAKTAGIELKIASGFRSFERQLQIWNNKFIGNTAIKNSNGETVEISHLSDWQIIEAILLYSALPGASRHHWGCDIDVYAPNLLNAGESLQLEPWEYQHSGPMEKLSTWLNQHAEEFGFYFPYDTYRGGIAAEPWHLSFVPLAAQYQARFNLQTLQTCLLNANIEGKTAIIDNLAEIEKRFINNVNTCLID